MNVRCLMNLLRNLRTTSNNELSLFFFLCFHMVLNNSSLCMSMSNLI